MTAALTTTATQLNTMALDRLTLALQPGGAGAGSGGVNVGGMSFGLPKLKFAEGGSFMVGGPEGIDRAPVFFMASRGERVTV